jgi:ABC-2 type transport system permease protein
VSLLLTIARAELRLHLRRRGYWLLFGLFAALVIVAAVLNGVRQQRERARQTELQRLVRAQGEGQPERHPHRVAHYGTFAFKPPGPLAAFDPGVDSYAGRSLYLEAHRQNAANFAEAGELSSAFRLGELSLAFVLQLVLPLVVVALGHRAFAGDAESGLLRLLLAQGVWPRTLAFGKLAGLAAALLPFFAVAAVATLGVLATDPAFRADPAAVLRLVAVVAALALHTVAWLGLTLWVSARARTSAAACAWLVTGWIAAALVVPRAAAAVASALHPLPDKSSFAAAVAEEVRRQGDSHNPDDPHFARFRAETLARHGVAKIEDLPFNYGAHVMARGEELSAAAFARHFDGLADLQFAQAAVLARAAWLAPTLAVRTLTAAAAGTDLRAQLDFQRAAERYRYSFVQHLNELHRDKIAYRGDRDQKLASDHWRRMPDFAPPELPFAAALSGTVPAWAVLLAWAALPLLLLARLRALVA